MSIASNLYTGISGLTAHSSAMNLISDNIANVNTVGYKSSRGNFSDLLGGHIAGDSVGQGVTISSVQMNFAQGSLIGTGNVTDLAIQGDGYFIVDGTINGVRDNFYTRNGAFVVNEDGNVINATGLKVQGYPIDAQGNPTTAIGDLSIDYNSLPPSATTSLEIVANLDAEQTVSGVAFDITDPVTTSDFQTSLTVYDSLGVSHQIEIYFSKNQDTPNPAWDYYAVADGDELDPAVPNALVQLGAGVMDFDTDGALNDYTLSAVNIQWAGADAATIALDLGSGTNVGGTGVDGITTYAIESTTTFLTQDGFTSGDLAGLVFDAQGVMSGMFSNGEQRALGQVALAKFSSNDGLSRQGGGMFADTRDSGDPLVGAPGTGGRGGMVSGSLEGSNVDLASEFVNMITVQRGFQANSKSITTADEMLSEVLALKR